MCQIFNKNVLLRTLYQLRLLKSYYLVNMKHGHFGTGVTKQLSSLMKTRVPPENTMREFVVIPSMYVSNTGERKCVT